MPSRRQFFCGLATAALPGCIGGNGSGSGSGSATPSADATDALGGTEPPTLAPDTVLLTVTDGDRDIDLLTVGGVADTGGVDESPRGAYVVPVELTTDGESRFEETLAEVGALENPEAHQIRTYLDGEVVFTASISTGLADTIESGEWDGTFRLALEEEAAARRLRRRLE